MMSVHPEHISTGKEVTFDLEGENGMIQVWDTDKKKVLWTMVCNIEDLTQTIYILEDVVKALGHKVVTKNVNIGHKITRMINNES